MTKQSGVKPPHSKGRGKQRPYDEKRRVPEAGASGLGVKLSGNLRFGSGAWRFTRSQEWLRYFYASDCGVSAVADSSSACIRPNFFIL
jgi:hypothetical protein